MTKQAILDENKVKTTSKPTKLIKQQADDFIGQMRAFESDRIANQKKLTGFAFKVASAFGVVALAAVVALVVLMPLKKTEPFVIRVDNTTGRTEVLQPLADAKAITYGEVLDKHFMRTYIIARNSYDWLTVQHDFNMVKIMSSPNVFVNYSKYITSEESPVKVFTDKKGIEVKNPEVSLLPDISKTNKIAQIHFTREVKNNKGSDATGYVPTLWTATITYDYQAKIETENERELNPLGFRVTSYREDRVTK